MLTRIKSRDVRNGNELEIHIMPGTMLVFRKDHIVARFPIGPGFTQAMQSALVANTLPLSIEAEAERRKVTCHEVLSELQRVIAE